MQYLLTAFEDITVWAESCCCHEHERRSCTWAKYRSALASEYFIPPNQSCCLQGLRAAELAAGAARTASAKIQDQNSAVVRGFATKLTAQETSQLLHDWHAASSLGKRLVATKFGVWEQLPLLLAGLGHHSEPIARRVGQKCLLEEKLDHPLSQLVLAPHSQIRKQLESFATGQAKLSDLHLLKLIADRLSFLPVCERSIEGRHRIAKSLMTSAPNINASTVSLRLREHELIWADIKR